MTGGHRRVRATFWLLEAPDSLALQSRRHPDGYGIATFEEDGSPEIHKRPAAAYEDEQFARMARDEESSTFLAHIRYASTGGLTVQNTHPFEQDGRVFAHNGYVGGLDALESRLGDTYRELVHGDTDSERCFALITSEIRARGTEEGVAAAVHWMARELPLYSINFVLATPTDLWALRYPETNSLLMMERAIGGPTGSRHFDAASSAGTVRVRSGGLAEQAAVIFASEPMDEDPGWRSLEPGELVHVDNDLRVRSRMVLDGPPAHRLRSEDLDVRTAASQREPRSTVMP
jgi:predicted glutamine amidotransferase